MEFDLISKNHGSNNFRKRKNLVSETTYKNDYFILFFFEPINIDEC